MRGRHTNEARGAPRDKQKPRRFLRLRCPIPAAKNRVRPTMNDLPPDPGAPALSADEVAASQLPLDKRAAHGSWKVRAACWSALAAACGSER